jgi:catechol 2,3-dioxygenase-like lactoylglutathione lyase family enzyme
MGRETAKKTDMSIRLLGLRTVIYPAPDLAAAKIWWTAFLGTPPYFDEPFYVGFNQSGYELGLLPDADPSAGALAYWGVDDVAEAVAAAIQAGALEHSPASDVGDGIITATVSTPSGSIVGFIYNPHFELPSIAG